MIACKDCKYCSAMSFSGVHCRNPKTASFDVVFGDQPQLAKFVRAAGQACGPEAKMFEPKFSIWNWLFNFYGPERRHWLAMGAEKCPCKPCQWPHCRSNCPTGPQ